MNKAKYSNYEEKAKAFKKETEMDALMDINRKFVDLLIDMKMQMDSAAIPQDGRVMDVPIELFPKEYEKGIRKLVGFSIRWI